MMLRVFAASLRRRARQLALVALAVGVAATTWAALAAFSARSRARLAVDLSAVGPNLVLRPQVGAPPRLALDEVARAAALPAIEVAAGIAEPPAAAVPALAASGLRLFASGPEILRLYPTWEIEGAWPRRGEMALGAELTPADAAALPPRPISGRLTTGQALDSAIFLPLADLPGLGVEGVDRIEVRAAPARLEAAIRELESAVAGAEVRPLERVTATDRRLERRLVVLLGGIGALTLALALISVAAATAALLNERRAEIALLSALGYSGHRVAGLVAAELAAAALVAAAAGALCGELVAAGLARRLFGAAGAAVTAGGALAAAAAALVVVAAGVLVTLRHLGRLEPAAVLRGD